MDELVQELPGISDSERATYFLARIKAIEDKDQRRILENYFVIWLEYGSGALGKRRVVALIHGIRTHARWFDLLEHILEEHANVEVCRIKYNYFDLFCFWFPLLFFRFFPQRRVTKALRRIRADYPSDTLVVVAHSFGTYLVSKVLKKNPDFRIQRLLMSGAIVPEGYDWENLPNFPDEKPVNDCGTRDYLPVLAKTSTFGYGYSGTFGFNSHLIKNRFFDLGHSDFFREENLSEYWVPYILDGDIRGSTWGFERNDPPAWYSLISRFQGQMLIIFIVIFSSIIYGLHI